MLKLVPFSDKYVRFFEVLSPERAKVLRFHGDVIPESAFAVVAQEGGHEAFLGAGFLQACQNYRARAEFPKLPFYNVMLDFALDFSDPEAVPAAEMLLEALIARGKALQAEEPEKALALTYWVRAEARETRGFLESFGFREAYRMYHMVRELSAGKVEGTPKTTDPAITEMDLRDPAAMARYVAYTKEGYGIPDSEAEMRFRILHSGARVFTIEEKTFATVWGLGNGAASTENVFTRKDFRRQGLSKRLLEGVAEILRTEGFEHLELNVYLKFAAPALRLYRSLGYRRAYTLLEMHKELSAFCHEKTI